MHELSITQSVLDISLSAARNANAGRVTAIDLLVGELTSFVDDSIQFYFDILSRGTTAEGATLRIRREAARGTCGECGHEFRALIPLLPACPACGSGRVRVTGGSELRVESIEVDDGNPGR